MSGFAGRKPLPLPLQVLVTIAALGLLLVVPPFAFFFRSFVAVQFLEVVRLAPLGKSYDDRRAAILGADYRLVAAVRDHTEPNAIVVMPASAGTDASPFSEQKARNRAWVQCFLYPRRVLTFADRGHALFREARWLFVNGPNALSWVYPPARPKLEPGQIGIVPFDMYAYLAAVDAGAIPSEYLPP